MWSKILGLLFYAALTIGFPTPNGTEPAGTTKAIEPLNSQTSPPDKSEMQNFWEVTKHPENKTPIIKDDIVDGNHPNLTEKLTHQHIDTSVADSQQTKRVKKILPPYNHNLTEQTHSTEMPLRPAVVEELTVVEIRHADDKNIAEATTNENKKPADGETKYEKNEKHIFFKYPDNVTERNAFLLEKPIEDINMQDSVSNNEQSPLATATSPEPDFKGETVLAVNKDKAEAQIEGIQLVPHRTVWDMIQERHEASNEIEQSHEQPFQDIKSPKSHNFDTESAEVDYETENFQRGLSNIEKHELPFSYALPWLQVKDKAFDDGNKDVKKPGVPQSAHFAAVSSNEELRIPADMSKLLQMSEMSEISQLPELGEDVAVRVVQSGEPQGRTKWYLLLLNGNSTIVQQRRSDFTKYLRLNLAARLSVEYDDVKVNKLILAPPRVLVNVSVNAPSDDVAEESQLDLKEKFEEKGEGPLHKLAESNATLLELSGEEYRVVRFLSLQAPQAAAQHGTPPDAQAQRDEPKLTALSTRHEDIEFVIFTFLGSACACAVIFTIFLAVNKYRKRWEVWDWPWRCGKLQEPSAPEECPEEAHCPIPPAVIYSGGFPQIRGSWMGNASTAPSEVAEAPPSSAANASLMQRHLSMELSTTQPASPRHNKLRMYNCRPDRVLVRKLPENCTQPPHN